MKKFDFIKNRKVFFIIVAAVVVIGICSFFIRGFNFDTDFIGGTTIHLEMNRDMSAADLDELRDLINGVEIGDTPAALHNASAEPAENTDDTADTADATQTVDLPAIAVKPQVSTIQKAGNGTQVIIKLLELDSDSRDALCNIIADNYDLDLSKDLLEVNNVGASVSSDLRNSAIIATVIAVVLMLVYITVRFEFASGVAAVICLAHDLFVMIVAYSLFQIPMNSTMIAALLTILGYSINATIIVFDRVRENVKLHNKEKFSDNVNTSINQTLLRSVNTTLTTLFTIGMVYILGVASIREFALPIIIGIIAGLFSSCCLSGNLWVIFKKLTGDKKKLK